MESNISQWKALIVPPHATLSLSLCNYANLEVSDVTIRNVSLVPPLVAAVGYNATVRVHIYNSANLHVSKRLVIGHALAQGEALDFERNDTSIINKVVHGPVDDGASILVDVDRSANVYLRKGTKDLWLGKATLLNELINAPHRQFSHCLTRVCFEVRLAHSSNVMAEVKGGPDLVIQDGQLDDESVDTGCVGEGSFVRVAKRNVSNVRDVKTLHIWDGELSDEAVDALHLRHARVEVSIHDSANVWADHVRIEEGELVDELVDARDVKHTSITVLASNVANVNARSMEILEGELVDEAIDARDLLHSSITITFTDVGNARVSKMLSIIEGQLVDELLDINTMNAGAIDIRLQRVSSVLCGSGSISLSSSELLESIIDTASVRDVRAVVYVEDVANVHVRDDWLHMVDSVLAKTAYDVDLLNTGIKYTEVRAARNLCARCTASSTTCADTKRHWRFFIPPKDN